MNRGWKNVGLAAVRAGRSGATHPSWGPRTSDGELGQERSRKDQRDRRRDLPAWALPLGLFVAGYPRERNSFGSGAAHPWLRPLRRGWWRTRASGRNVRGTPPAFHIVAGLPCVALFLA